MLLNNYLKLKQENLLLILLIIFSFLIRVPVIIFLGGIASMKINLQKLKKIPL